MEDFSDFVYSSHCAWHWACDEGFDAGSSIWHFDVENRIRLIAEKTATYHGESGHDNKTLIDTWLDADQFYGVLGEWHKAFEAEWKASHKISESDDGAEGKD